MKIDSIRRLMIAGCLVGMIGSGCEKSNTTSKSSSSPPKAASSRPIIQPVSKSVSTGSQLHLTGLTMKIPDGWKAESVPAGPMSPKAVYRLSKAGHDAEDGMVRVTYFPGMKGKDDMNIERWLGQVTNDDGSTITRDDASISTTQSNQVRLTVVDVMGTIKITMRAMAKPNSRMIAAIVDHPQGPHFVVAAGGVATMQKWETDLMKFLHSAAVK